MKSKTNILVTLFEDLAKEKPIYIDTEKMIPQASLPKEVETLVIGGGLLGLSTALTLAEEGHDVVLVERNKIGEGPSGRSGGQLWPGFDMSLSEMKKEFGYDLTLKAWNLNFEALHKVHKHISKRHDKCDFTAGLILTSKTKDQAKYIEKEIKVYKDIGLDFASYISKKDMKNYINTDSYFNGILYKGNEEGKQYGHINPFKYTKVMAELAYEKGVKITENNPVEKVTKEGKHYLVKTSQGEIKAKNVVFATGVDFLRPEGIDFNIIPRTYVSDQTVVLATEPISKELAEEMVPAKVCFCDANEVDMSYVALTPSSEYLNCYHLTFGGADALMQAETVSEIPKIEKEMRTMFPQLDRENIKIEKIWGGNCDLSRSGLPVIDNPCEGIYYANGFSGQGMVNTSLYGTAIAEKIIGKDTSKFDTLKQLNPKPYSNNILIAWMQEVKQIFF